MTTNVPGMLHYPATERNKDPILQTLKNILPIEQKSNIDILEIASGSGQHSSYFAAALPNVTWQPSDCDESCLRSIEIYVKNANRPNLKRPITIDVNEAVESWAGGMLSAESFDAIFACNLIHISPWKTTEGLFAGSGHYLKENGYLITYGPYKVDGRLTPESNVQFDESLRGQNSSWGIRDIGDLDKLGYQFRLKLEYMCDMPANNKTLVFRKMCKDE